MEYLIHCLIFVLTLIFIWKLLKPSKSSNSSETSDNIWFVWSYVNHEELSNIRKYGLMSRKYELSQTKGFINRF